MATSQPIRYKEDLQNFLDYYHFDKIHLRNYALIVVGLNTALRISDILNLKWKDVYDFDREELRLHITVEEKKTGKTACIILNDMVKTTLDDYFIECGPLPEHYLFSRKNNRCHPINRSTAYRIIRNAATKCGMPEHITPHSMRKTFGYQAWQKGTPPVLIMDIFNHSSFHITRRYLGIEQEDKDVIFMELDL